MFLLQARADTTFSSEVYYNANDLLSNIRNSKSVSAGVTVGIGLAKIPVTGEVGLSGSKDSALLNKLSKYQNKVLKHNAVSHSIP